MADSPVEPPSEAVRCEAHPAEQAGWRCTECGRALCPACAVRRTRELVWVPSCGFCGAYAEVLRVERHTQPLGPLLRGIVSYPLQGHGPSVLLGGAVVLALVFALWWPGALLGSAIVASYLFHVIQESGRGRDELPAANDYSGPADFFEAGAAFLCSLALALAPAWLWAWVAYPGGLPDAWRALLPPRDPLAAALLLAGLAWAPMVLLFVAVRTPLPVALNPAAALGAIRRTGRDYALVGTLFWLFLGAWVGLDVLAARVSDLPVVPDLVTLPFRLYAALLAARSLGLLLHVHGGRIGYGRAADYTEPALGDRRPDAEVLVASATEELRGVGNAAARGDAAPPVEPIDLADLSGGPVSEFVAYQPSADVEAIDLPEAELPPAVPAPPPLAPPLAPAAAPAAARPAGEDLLPEDEFFALMDRTPERPPRGGR